ncbi:hypothetical protein Q3G72_010248 [Acer saccharum]|nr:hypothetical protein Q3G72_010248 [Acer saccharum]
MSNLDTSSFITALLFGLKLLLFCTTGLLFSSMAKLCEITLLLIPGISSWLHAKISLYSFNPVGSSFSPSAFTLGSSSKGYGFSSCTSLSISNMPKVSTSVLSLKIDRWHGEPFPVIPLILQSKLSRKFYFQCMSWPSKALYGQLLMLTTTKSSRIVRRHGAVPNLISSFTVPKDLTSATPKPFSGTWKGSKSFLSSHSSSYTLALKISVELPLSIITRRTSLRAIWTPTTSESLGFTYIPSKSSAVKTIGSYPSFPLLGSLYTEFTSVSLLSYITSRTSDILSLLLLPV